MFRRTSNALGHIGNGLKTGLADSHAADLTPAITSIFDPFNRRFNLFKGVSLAVQETQREFLIEVAAAKFRHVGRHTGGAGMIVVQSTVGHLGHDASESCPQSQEPFKMGREVRRRHFVGLYVNVVVMLVTD